MKSNAIDEQLSDDGDRILSILLNQWTVNSYHGLSVERTGKQALSQARIYWFWTHTEMFGDANAKATPTFHYATFNMT
ncbi:hypothetical protein [Calothrix sp. PCC 7507]|uniref:hypothetical protein n=1 Tax=Calothrix sp. PCC 7507 TaxID=99598 RepID=UPI0005A8CF6A|nr:hypothetical protein [Calothrix sp. PCC 7507]